MPPLNIIIVEKNATLKSLAIKEYNEEELFKKCGFKKADGFEKQHTWKTKISNVSYGITVYAKEDGKAGGENKYDFPPPIDTKLFFGSCAIVASTVNNDKQEVTSLSLDLWEKIYEKLFGGFEDLAVTGLDDEDEEDELALVPKDKKTKQGYLKDGFVVDSGSDEASEKSWETEDEDEDEEEGEEEEDDGEEGLELEIGSELSEEAYDYKKDDVDLN